jgi:hypothetical protein
MAGRPSVAVAAALRALPATDRRLQGGRVWRTENETAMPAACNRLRGDVSQGTCIGPEKL